MSLAISSPSHFNVQYDSGSDMMKEIALVMELENILKDKNSQAKKLKQERLSREASFVEGRKASSNNLATDGNVSDEDERIDFDMESVVSVPRKTFITEPKLAKRGSSSSSSKYALCNHNAFVHCPLIHSLVDLEGTKLDDKKYRKGDFVTRNILVSNNLSGLYGIESHRIHLLNNCSLVLKQGFTMH